MKKLLMVAPVALLLAGCGGAVMPTAAPTTTLLPTIAGPTTPAAEAITCLPGERSGDVSASIVDFAFEPSEISATIGQTVAWTNTGQAPHTVTFDDGPDCGRVDAGGSIAAQLTAAGDYHFHCAIHPSMRGTVSVRP